MLTMTEPGFNFSDVLKEGQPPRVDEDLTAAATPRSSTSLPPSQTEL